MLYPEVRKLSRVYALLIQIFIYLMIAVLPRFAFAQDAARDSVFFMQQVQDLIQQKQYASAHNLLDERLQKEGMRAFYVCWMVRNGLQHFYRQTNYDIFYLKDEDNHVSGVAADSLKGIRTARLRYPQRMLQMIIDQRPQYAWAYKLLGDYYNIQFRDLTNFDFVQNTGVKDLEQKILKNYSQAQKLGFKSFQTYRWLGDYYMSTNALDTAQSLYLKSIKIEPKDAISLYHLAEISSQKKLFTQAYNYANEALKYFSPSDVYLRYDALLLSAESLKELGELDKFLYYMNDCIQSLPKMQAAYIDLAHFYDERGQTAKSEKMLRRMLLNNPYDLEGYRVLEQYIVAHQSFYFGDSLFDAMLMKYENWDEVLANIYWSKGNLSYYQGLSGEAKKYWDISRNYMRRYLPDDSPILKQVGEIAQKKAIK